MLATALFTPFPLKASWLSLSSKASLEPVDAPLGTIEVAQIPLSKVILHETVGVPLESMI
jgi:hypothetical protein